MCDTHVSTHLSSHICFAATGSWTVAGFSPVPVRA